MLEIPDMPLSLAAPVLATTLAYLNAKYSLFYDRMLIKVLLKIAVNLRSGERRDKVNLFYKLESHALNSKTRDRPFLVYNGRSWTFHEAYITVLQYGAWLKKVHGVKPREIVAMDFMNSSTYIFIWFGLWSIGAVPAFINYNLLGKTLTHSVQTSSARLLLVDEELRAQFPPEQLETFASPDFREGKGSVDVVLLTSETEAQILQVEPTREDDQVRDGVKLRDTAALIYTSGTTGLPKPAIIGWRKAWSTGIMITNWINLKSTDRYYTSMPLYHSSASLLAVMPCLWTGCASIIGRRFSARNFWQEVRESEATIIQYVGETMRYLLAVPPAFDPVTGEDLDKKHNLRLAVGNGLRPDIWNRVKERFNIPGIAEFYASTEGTSGSWNLSYNDFGAGAIGRNGGFTSWVLGRSIAMVKVDEVSQQPWRDPKTGFCKQVPRGEPGELLWALNPTDPNETFSGYFNNSKASDSKVIRDVLRKGDAFFRTGDLVRWDKEGRWYFNDRLGDTYRWRSQNVSTAEVSEVLGGHTDVHEANVYGVALPHHDGRAGCATILLQQQTRADNPSILIPPTQETLSSLSAHVLKNLPRYAAPQFLRVTLAMQTTGNNKQQKHVLQSQGVDPSLVAAEDRLYWLQGNQYVPFERDDWSRLQAGKVKL
ncbi:putative long-chain fatty acid transporter [Aspergillus saccharolyticus JOP 1030-1]|uniref:Very long-chain fatty acid transport protein n=1 Tax=Aspergillus saccharolyticus JOP 1030-1 TaxID=1450539 RepID=A0A318ZN56_9EURO|nr:very long-chain acyl-CoA synthetase/fatty acid transporter [Aspergillus saccharolyticus JOP 1030-1]PYH49029.1 very long-chain acyl-CoA synthetase/fatty acid transporter [Aspergillus saccharolyticus JOP 1030-1]